MSRCFRATSWVLCDNSTIPLNKPYRYWFRKQDGWNVLGSIAVTASLDLTREGLVLRVLENHIPYFDVTGGILFCLDPDYIFDVFWGDIFIFPYSKEIAGQQFRESHNQYYSLL